MGMCTANFLRDSRQANCGYPTVAFCRAIYDIVVLVRMRRVCNRVRNRRNKSNHGYPMVAATTIVSRLILQRGGSVFINGWATNHGYPVLVNRPTVCMGECVSGYRYASVGLSGVLSFPKFFLGRLET